MKSLLPVVCCAIAGCAIAPATKTISAVDVPVAASASPPLSVAFHTPDEIRASDAAVGKLASLRLRIPEIPLNGVLETRPCDEGDHLRISVLVPRAKRGLGRGVLGAGLAEPCVTVTARVIETTWVAAEDKPNGKLGALDLELVAAEVAPVEQPKLESDEGAFVEAGLLPNPVGEAFEFRINWDGKDTEIGKGSAFSYRAVLAPCVATWRSDFVRVARGPRAHSLFSRLREKKPGCYTLRAKIAGVAVSPRALWVEPLALDGVVLEGPVSTASSLRDAVLRPQVGATVEAALSVEAIGKSVAYLTPFQSAVRDLPEIIVPLTSGSRAILRDQEADQTRFLSGTIRVVDRTRNTILMDLTVPPRAEAAAQTGDYPTLETAVWDWPRSRGKRVRIQGPFVRTNANLWKSGDEFPKIDFRVDSSALRAPAIKDAIAFSGEIVGALTDAATVMREKIGSSAKVERATWLVRAVSIGGTIRAGAKRHPNMPFSREARVKECAGKSCIFAPCEGDDAADLALLVPTNVHIEKRKSNDCLRLSVRPPEYVDAMLADGVIDGELLSFEAGNRVSIALPSAIVAAVASITPSNVTLASGRCEGTESEVRIIVATWNDAQRKLAPTLADGRCRTFHVSDLRRDGSAEEGYWFEGVLEGASLTPIGRIRSGDSNTQNSVYRRDRPLTARWASLMVNPAAAVGSEVVTWVAISRFGLGAVILMHAEGDDELVVENPAEDAEALSSIPFHHGGSDMGFAPVRMRLVRLATSPSASWTVKLLGPVTDKELAFPTPSFVDAR